jgi:exonuclease III
VSSFIDYFMISDEMTDNLSEFKVLENVVNLSDHSPIHIIIDLRSEMSTCMAVMLGL